LSGDGHPKGARGHALARSQQLPTAVVSPTTNNKKDLPLFEVFAFAPYSYFTGNLVENQKYYPYFFKTRKLTGFSGSGSGSGTT